MYVQTAPRYPNISMPPYVESTQCSEQGNDSGEVVPGFHQLNLSTDTSNGGLRGGKV